MRGQIPCGVHYPFKKLQAWKFGVQTLQHCLRHAKVHYSGERVPLNYSSSIKRWLMCISVLQATCLKVDDLDVRSFPSRFLQIFAWPVQLVWSKPVQIDFGK